MSTPLLTSFVSHNETQNLKILTTRISSAPIRTLTSTKKNTNFSSNSFTSLKANDTKYNSTNHSEPLERFTISYVIKRGYFNLVRYLLSLGIDPNHVSVKESYPDMYTPLIYCTFIKDEKWALSVAQNLLEHGADLKKTDVNKLNPIHYCCAFGLESLLNLFLNSIDFDLSRSLDSNGNNCMHYAIRSHNLNCVKLIIDKFKPNEMYKKIDLKNSLSLKPSQIEDEINFNSIIYFNYKFPGHDSLDLCRETLVNFIKEHHILRTVTKQIIQPKLIESDTESKLKKESKSKNKRSNKLKTKKNSAKSSSASLQQQNEKSEFKSTFFQTEIEPIIEETRAVSVAATTTSPKSKPKKKTSKSSKSSKDEPIIEQIIVEPVLQQPEVIISEKIEKEEKPIDKEKAKYLTSKSFIISLKERLSNLITFSDLFVAREHMFQSVILGKDQSKPKLRSGPLKPDIKIYKDSCKSASEGFSYMEPVKTWKTTLPNMFVSLESFLTPSYRETVQPMSPNFFKKSLKKASKKSSSNLDSSFKSSTSKRLISSSKIERKTSTPHLIQKINEYEGGN